MTLETDRRAASSQQQQVGASEWGHKAEGKLQVMLPQLEALRARHQHALSRNKQLKALVSDLAHKQHQSPTSTPSISQAACLTLSTSQPATAAAAPCAVAPVPVPSAAAPQVDCLPPLDPQPLNMAGQAQCAQDHSLGNSSGAGPHQPSTPSTGPTSSVVMPQQGLAASSAAAGDGRSTVAHSHHATSSQAPAAALPTAADASAAGPPAPATIQKHRCKRTPVVHRSPAPSGMFLAAPAPPGAGAAGGIAAAGVCSSAPISSSHARRSPPPAASAATAAALLLSSPQLQHQQQPEAQQEQMEDEADLQQQQEAMEPAPSAGLDALVEAALLQAPSTVLPARGARYRTDSSWEGPTGPSGSAGAASTSSVGARRHPPALFVHVEDPCGDLPQAVQGLTVSARGPGNHLGAPGVWTGDGGLEEDLFGGAIAALTSGRGSPQQHGPLPWGDAEAGGGRHPRQQVQGAGRKRRRPARSNSSDEEWSEGEEAAYLLRQQQPGRRGTRTRQLQQVKEDGTYEYYAPSSEEDTSYCVDDGISWALLQEVRRGKRSRLLHAPKHHQQPLPAKQQHLVRLQQVVAHLLEYVPSEPSLPSPLPSPRGGRSSGCSSPRLPPRHKRGSKRMSPHAAAAVAASRLRAFVGAASSAAGAGEAMPGGPATPSLDGRGWRTGMPPPRPLQIPGSPKGNSGPYVQVFSPTGLPSLLTLSPGPASLGLPWNPLSPGSPMRLLSPIGTTDTPLRAMYATFAASPLRTVEAQLALPSPAFGGLVVNGAPLTAVPGSPALVTHGEAREGAGWAARSRAVRSNAAAAAALLTRPAPPAATAAGLLATGSLALRQGAAGPMQVTPARPLGPGTLSLRPDGHATWMPLGGALLGGPAGAVPRPSVSAAGPPPMPLSVGPAGCAGVARSGAVRAAAMKQEATAEQGARGAECVGRRLPAPAASSMAAVEAAASDHLKRSASEAAAAAAAAEAAEAAEAAAAAAVAAVRAAGLPQIKAEAP